MCVACEYGHLDIANLLLYKYNASPFTIYCSTATLLHYLVRFNSEQACKLVDELVTRGASLASKATSFDKFTVNHIYGGTTMTPLHTAIIYRQSQMVWKLISHGAPLGLTTHPNLDTPEFTVWELCKNENGEYDTDTYEALLHFWTPKTHKFHPTCVKMAIKIVLLVAHRQQWKFEQYTLHRILSFIAYEWIH